MVQELHVLKCFSCETFQSHIVKKSNKWECKVCGTKQSIKKVYGRGSGKDCRVHTQKLNSLRGEKNHNCNDQSHEEDIDILHPEQQTAHVVTYNNITVKERSEPTSVSSKWEVFLEDRGPAKQNINSKALKISSSDMSNISVKINPNRKRSFENTKPILNGKYNDSIDNLYLDCEFSIPNTHLKQTNKSKYNQKNYKSNIHLDQNNLCEFEAENKYPMSKQRKLESKIIPSKVSLKWSKYLEPEETYSAPAPFSSNSEDVENVESEFNLYNISVTEKKSVLSEVNNCDPRVNNEANCSTVELNLMENKSLPVFEQDCELHCSDFNLDF